MGDGCWKPNESGLTWYEFMTCFLSFRLSPYDMLAVLRCTSMFQDPPVGGSINKLLSPCDIGVSKNHPGTLGPGPGRVSLGGHACDVFRRKHDRTSGPNASEA